MDIQGSLDQLKAGNGFLTLNFSGEQLNTTLNQWLIKQVAGKKVLHLGACSNPENIENDVAAKEWRTEKIMTSSAQYRGTIYHHQVDMLFEYVDDMDKFFVMPEGTSHYQVLGDLVHQYAPDTVVICDDLELSAAPVIDLTCAMETIKRIGAKVILCATNASNRFNQNLARKHSLYCYCPHIYSFTPTSLLRIALMAGIDVQALYFLDEKDANPDHEHPLLRENIVIVGA